MRILLKDLQPSSTYSLQLRAIGTGGETSPWSRTFTIVTTNDTDPPSPVTGLTVDVAGASFVANWTAPITSQDGTPLRDLKGYRVVITSSLFVGKSQEFTTVGTRFELPFAQNVDIFGAPAATVTFEVQAIDLANNLSTAVSATATNPAPSPVTGLTGEALSDGIALRWNPNTTDQDIKAYEVWLSTTGASGTYTKIHEGLANTYTHASTVYGVDHWYRVYAVDVFNTKSTATQTASPLRPVSPFSMDTTPPGTPTGTAATITTTAGRASLNVSWTNAPNPDGDLSHTVVGYRPVGTSGWSYVNVDYTETSTRIEGVQPYTNYEVRTRAMDWSANASAWSSVVTTSTAATNTAPATVTGVGITAGRDAVNVYWNENSEDDVKNGAGVYLVQIATNSGFTTGLLEYRTGATQISVTGLNQNQTYYARVKAVDSAGLASASWSTVVNAVTGTISDFKYTVGGTEPTVKNVGDIWMDTATGFEKQWTGSGWANTGNASVTYVDNKTNTLVKNYVTEYASNSSETVAPSTGWSTTPPTRTPGTFIWYRIVVTYGDNSTTTTTPALLTGNTGATGAPGAPAPFITLTATTQVLTSPAAGGATTPATSVVTGTATNTTISVWQYSVDGGSFSGTVPTGVSRSGNVVTITGATMTARTITVRMADANGVADTLTVAKVFEGADGGPGTPGTPGTPGADAYTVVLTNESHTFPGTTSTAVTGSATTSVIAYKGTSLVNATIGTITGQVTGLTTSITNNGTNNATVTVNVTTSLVTQSGVLVIPITVDGQTFSKRFSWSVSYQGAQGSPAPTIDLTATTQVLTSPAGGGATSPATAVVTGAASNTTITVWQYSVDGGTFTNTVPTGASRSGNVVTITGSTMTAKTIAVRMADANGVADTLTVAKVFDGAAGSPGSPGTPGADAYTVLLTNEAHTFPGTTSAAIAGNTNVGVIAYKGSTQVAATIGTITGQVTGLTTGIANNGTTSANFTVTVTTSLTTQSGVLVVPVTVDGQTFSKRFSWTVTREGAPGGPGPTGVSVTSVTPYFITTATGAATPAKPTTNPPGGSWTATEPSYAANTELWRTERILFSNSTFAYTDVTKVSSYAAVIAMANGKNKVTHSTSGPGSTANVAGDMWIVYDGSNNIVEEWRGNGGTSWTKMLVSNAFISNLDAGKLTAGSAFITTLNIGSGGVIQSAGYTGGGTSGFQLSNTGLTIKGTGNVVDVGAVSAGTISAKTWNVGAGGVINVDSTGQIKSNNYAANSTGYKLSNTGLEINDGSIDAKALRANTAVIGKLVIGVSGNNDGAIESLGYSAGQTGFRLDKTGLEVNQGTVAAAALKVQASVNMMPAAFADFEYGDYYYLGSFWNARGQNKMSVSGGLGNANTYNPANPDWKPRTGTRYMGISNLGGTAAITAWFGANATDYNIEVEPGQTYIFSGYFQNVSAVNSQWNLVVKGNNGSTLVTTPIDLGGGVSQTEYTRAWTMVTIPASGVTSVITGLSNTSATAKDIHMDSMQFEPAYARTEPTLWTSPGVTAISPSGIQTGVIRSNDNITVNGENFPKWSINMEGAAQFSDAMVRGKLVVGNESSQTNIGNSNPTLELATIAGYNVFTNGTAAIARVSTSPIEGSWSLRALRSAGNTSILGIFFPITARTSGQKFRVKAKVRLDTVSTAGDYNISFVIHPAVGATLATFPVVPVPRVSLGSIYDIDEVIVADGDIDRIYLYAQSAEGTTIYPYQVMFDELYVYTDPDAGFTGIQSGNYVTGVSGWRIDSSGDAEFSAGTFRGALMAGNQFAITRGGEQVATIDPDGRAAFTEMESAVIKTSGEDIIDIISGKSEGVKDIPGKIVARGTATFSSATTSAEATWFQLDYSQQPNRQYQVNWSLPLRNNTSGGRGTVRIRYTTDGSQPSLSSPTLYVQRGTWSGLSAGGVAHFVGHCTFDTGASAVDTRLLFTVSSDLGPGTVHGDGTIASEPARAWVVDMGPSDLPDNVINRVSGSPPATKKTYTTVWTANNSECYNGSGGIRSNANDLVQGDVNTTNGNSHGMALFTGNSVSGGQVGIPISTAVSGATINKVEVYLYANHWYYGSGGTARIRAATNTTLTGTTPSEAYKDVPGWGRSVGKWVDITSLAIAANGTIRSIKIGKSPSASNYTYYGRFNAHNQSNPPKLRITYTK